MTPQETFHRSREVQKRIEAQNFKNAPVKIIVVQKSCFTREIRILLDKDALLRYEEDRWESALTVAEAIHNAYKKGLAEGTKKGEEKEFNQARNAAAAYYDLKT